MPGTTGKPILSRHETDREEHSGGERGPFRGVKQEVAQFKEDVSHAADSGVEVVKSGVHQAVDMGKRATDSMRSSLSRACDCISEHPAASVLIAAGVGALLGRLFLMRR